MNWLIVFTMLQAEPLVVNRLQFSNELQCLKYVNNAGNASTLAIEVIEHAGFNDEILDVQCVLESKIVRKEYET